MVYHTSKSTWRRTNGNVVRDYETIDIDSYRIDPQVPPVKGQWVDIGDGNRFRLPTPYTRAEVSIEREQPLLAVGRRSWNNDPWVDRTGPGGYGLSNFFSGNWVYRYNSALDLPSIEASPNFETFEENESVVKSLSKIADQKANMSENIATLGMTIRLFSNPVQGFIDLTKKLREEKSLWPLIRRSYRDWNRGGVSKRLADLYLQYVYGVAPLIGDAYGIAEFAKEQAKKPLLLNGRGSSEHYLSAPTYQFHNVSGEQKEYWHSCVAQSVTRTTCWAQLSKNHPGLRSLNQLGLLNPASLAWELVPYSFLIDWFVPIGPVLQAFTAPAGLDFIGGSTSRRLKAYWNYEIESAPPSDIVLDQTNQFGGGKFRYNGYRRKTLTNWPRPGIYFNQDPFGFSNDGSDRVFKALALGLSNLRRL